VFRQATPARTVASEARGAWQYVFPARRPGSLLRLASYAMRVAPGDDAAVDVQCVCLVHGLQCFSDALKVDLLVFLEFWLETYPLS